MGDGLIDFRGLATHGDRAEKPAGVHLVTASYVGAGEIEEIASERTSFVHAADKEQGLAQLSEHDRMLEDTVPRGEALQHLVQER
jgi:hypothetical protein